MITYYYTSFLMPHLWNLHVTCCHSWLLLQKLSHLSSFGHDGCTSLQGSSWSQPKFHSPEWQRWWENGRRQNAFCTGSPAVRSEGNELSRKGKQWAVLPTMTSFMTTQTHKRITTRKKVLILPLGAWSTRALEQLVIVDNELNYSHQSDSLDHVLDMAADGADCGQFLPVAPPFIYTKLRKTAQRFTSLSKYTKKKLNSKRIIMLSHLLQSKEMVRSDVSFYILKFWYFWWLIGFRHFQGKNPQPPNYDWPNPILKIKTKSEATKADIWTIYTDGWMLYTVYSCIVNQWITGWREASFLKQSSYF